MIDIHSIRFCHFYDCVSDGTGLGTIWTITKKPVFTPHCEWTDRVFAEIIRDAAASIFQISFHVWNAVTNVGYRNEDYLDKYDNSQLIQWISQFKVAVSSNEWKEAYINYVNEHGNIYDSFGYTMEIYKLVNINNDNIPELYINFGSTASGDVICTYYEGKVVEQPMWNYGFSYIEGQNIFRDAGGHMDVYHDKIYSIENGQFVLLHEGNYGAADNSHVQFDSDGNPVYNYYWNGTEVSSETEYMNLLNEVYNTQQAITPFDGAEYDSETWRYVGNGLCDYEEIIEAINAY